LIEEERNAWKEEIKLVFEEDARGWNTKGRRIWLIQWEGRRAKSES